MFKQMLLSSSSRHSKKNSFIYNNSFGSKANEKSKSLDILHRDGYSNVINLRTKSKRNSCKSARTYKEIQRELEYNRDSNTSIRSCNSIANEIMNSPDEINYNIETENENITKKLKSLSSKFQQRTESVKKSLKKQISSEIDKKSEKSSDEEYEIPKYNKDWLICDENEVKKDSESVGIRNKIEKVDSQFNSQTYELHSKTYICWLIILNLAYLYNCWFIILRTFFPIHTKQNIYKFIVIDLFCDLLYLIDIFWFKCRLRHFENGLLIKESHLIRKKYFREREFIIDCLSLIPLDILYVFTGVKPFLRFPRFFKISCFHQLFHCLDSIAKQSQAYIFRILKTLIYMMFLVHLNATAYYYISYLSNFDSKNQWIYNNKGNAYLRCFYFAIRTATSISGRMSKPTNSSERAFMTFSWLMGVFVFAFLIGQIRDIVSNATQNETHYRMVMDQMIRYMKNMKVLPETTQRRIKDWLNFTWKQQNTFDEYAILSSLPTKSCLDISFDLHIRMLNQIDLFHCVERPVICELVNCLKPILFLPGDFIFKKDDLGTDMYIVDNGKVQVFADRECNKLLATLGKGSVFGEISVLLDSSKRRTASIRSVGYSTLFRLQKNDLMEILSNYPEAHLNLKRKAKQLMKQRSKQERSITSTETELFDSIRADSVIKDSISNKNKFADTVIELMKQKKSKVFSHQNDC